MYFIYKHYQDGKVFYVGMGKCKKVNGISKYKRAYDDKQRSESWKLIAKEGFTFEIVEESEDKKHIINREKYWIDYYGRRLTGGQLVNISPGGHYFVEDPIKKHTRMLGNKISLGRKMTNEVRQKMSLKKLNNKNATGYRSYATKINISLSKIGNSYRKGKYRNAKGQYLNLETGLIFDTIMDINRFFFDGSIKTLLTLKSYVYKNKTYKGLTFYRITK